MELDWTSEAMKDRDNIFDYIAEENRTAALTLDLQFEEKALQLIHHPYLG